MVFLLHQQASKTDHFDQRRDAETRVRVGLPEPSRHVHRGVLRRASQERLVRQAGARVEFADGSRFERRRRTSDQRGGRSKD